MRTTALITLLMSAALATPGFAQMQSRAPSFVAMPPSQNVGSYGVFDRAAPLPNALDNEPLQNMDGKPVVGLDGHRIGHVLAVDTGNRLLDVQLPSGIALAMRADIVRDKGDHLLAPTITHSDVLAMQKTQTGGTAVEIAMLGLGL